LTRLQKHSRSGPRKIVGLFKHEAQLSLGTANCTPVSEREQLNERSVQYPGLYGRVWLAM